MPRRVTSSDVAAVAALAAQGIPTKAIARQSAIPRRTVRDILAGLGPELDDLKTWSRDAMMATWQDSYFDAYEDMRTRRNAGDLIPRDRQSLTLSMAIATDKLALLAGQPTAIVANVHEVRVSMPDLLSKLAAVGRVLSAEATALPAPISRPGEAADEPSDPSTTPDRNPSPTQSATPKQALTGPEPSGQPLPPTSDNSIYVAYAQDDVTPASTRTSDASA